MASSREHRENVIKSMKEDIDSMIMMCDSEGDLIALASLMSVSSKNIFVQRLGREAAIRAFQKIIEAI